MRNSYSDIQTFDVLSKACSQFSIDGKSIRQLGSFENIVYEGKRFDKTIILRLSESGHRPYSQIFSELEFVEFLNKKGAPVIKPITSNKGTLAVKIPCDGHYYTAIAYHKAIGRLTKKEDLTPSLFEKMGQVTGLLHRIANDYKPSKPRPFCLDDHYYRLSENLAIREPDFYGIFAKHLEKMRPKLLAYPQVLSHTDMHYKNFTIFRKKLKIFDFDDCAYAPHAFDIITPAFYIAGRQEEQRKEDCITYCKAFIKGYKREHLFDPSWFELFSDMLDLRAMLLYDATLQYLANNSPSEVEVQRIKTALGEELTWLKAGKHWVDLDFPANGKKILE